MTTKKKRNTDATVSSGNIFADLGHKNPEILEMKSHFAWLISHELEKRMLSQNKASQVLGISQGDVSKLKGKGFDKFSTEKYYSFLSKLGLRVEVRIKKATKNRPAGVALA